MALNSQQELIPYQSTGSSCETQPDYVWYVDKIFQDSDGDLSEYLNKDTGTMETCVRSSIMEYSNDFRFRARAHGGDKFFPVFDDKVLKEFHDKASNSAIAFCDALCKRFSSVNSSEAKPKLESDLNTIFTLIQNRNKNRKNELLKDFTKKELQNFQKRLQSRYEYLYEDEERESGKFYDKYFLEYNANEVKKVCLERIEVYAEMPFLQNQVDEKMKFDTICHARKMMTQECTRIGTKNAHIRAGLTENLSQLLLDLENGTKQLMETLKLNPYNKLECESIREETENIKQKIEVMVKSHSVENFEELTQEFHQKADNFWEKVVQKVESLKKFKKAAYKRKMQKKLAITMISEAEKDGIPRNEIEELVREIKNVCKQEQETVNTNGNLIGNEIGFEEMDDTTLTPSTPEQEPNTEMDSANSVDPFWSVRTDPTFKRSFNDTQDLFDEWQTNGKKTRPGSPQHM